MTSSPTPAVLPDARAREVRLRMFLEILAASCGQADASDYRWNWINAFCGEHEGYEPDTFNTAHDAGYTTVSHDSDTDSGIVRLTDAGRTYLATPPASDAAVPAELRALSDRATPGPWAWEQCGEKEDVPVIGIAFPGDDPDCKAPYEGEFRDSDASRMTIAYDWQSCDGHSPSANAAFAVAAVNYVRAMLAAAPKVASDTQPDEQWMNDPASLEGGEPKVASDTGAGLREAANEAVAVMLAIRAELACFDGDASSLDHCRKIACEAIMRINVALATDATDGATGGGESTIEMRQAALDASRRSNPPFLPVNQELWAAELTWKAMWAARATTPGGELLEQAARVAEDEAEGARVLHNAAAKDRDRDGTNIHGEAWRVSKQIAAAIRALSARNQTDEGANT